MSAWWDVVGTDEGGVERYRVTGYESEGDARGSLEFPPRDTGLAYSVPSEESAQQKISRRHNTPVSCLKCLGSKDDDIGTQTETTGADG